MPFSLAGIGRGLGQGLNQATLGLATASQSWPGQRIQQQRLKAAQEASDTDRRGRSARLMLELAIKSGQPLLISQAIRGAQEAGVVPDTADPSLLQQGLIPKEEPTPYEQVSGVPGAFYRNTDEGEVEILKSELYQAEDAVPTYQDFLKDAQRISETNGFEKGKSYIEGMLQRPLTEEELGYVGPALADGAAIVSELDNVYTTIMAYPEAVRRQVFDDLTPALQGDLLKKYGTTLRLPAPIDPALKRRAKEAEVQSVYLDELNFALHNPEIRESMGPSARIPGTPAWWHFHSPWQTDAQIFRGKVKITTQSVGRFLEGGVLRSQFDEEKYIAIMPQYWDLPETAQGKLNNVRKLVRLMSRLYDNAGIPEQVVDQTGNVVEAMTLPDLPFNPADPSIPLAQIKSWIQANPDYEHADLIIEILRTRVNVQRIGEE